MVRFLNARTLWLLRREPPVAFVCAAERMLSQQWRLVRGAVDACGWPAAAVAEHAELSRRFLRSDEELRMAQQQQQQDEDPGRVLEGALARFTGLREGLQQWHAKVGSSKGGDRARASVDRAMSGSFFVLASLDAAVGHAEVLQCGLSGDGVGAAGVLSEDVPLLPLLQHCVEDVSAFSVEKYGSAPNFELDVVEREQEASSSLRLQYCIDGFIVYSLMEVLKNACVAMVNAYGALDVDDEDQTPAVRVRAAPNFHRNGVEVCIRDFGMGLERRNGSGSGDDGGSNSSSSAALLTRAVAFDPFAFYATRDTKDLGGPAGQGSVGEQEQQVYGYSRDHGAPMCGMGVGLSRARVYAAFHGGTLDLRSASDSERRGAIATLQLPLLSASAGARFEKLKSVP